jgi:glycosyltransferase involved in cell wall biosynthesis
VTAFEHIGPADGPQNGVALYTKVVDECLRPVAAGLGDIAHVELGYTGHAELWKAYDLVKRRRKLVLTLHDPPVVTGKPFLGFVPGQSLPMKLVRKALDLSVGRFVVRKVVRHAAAVIILNPLAKDGLVKQYGLDPNKVHVAPLPEILPLPDVRKDGHEGLRVLFFGNLSPRKGVHLLIQAFAEAFADDAHATLTVAGSHRGEDAYMKALEGARERFSDPSRIVFLGFLEDAELGREVIRADVVVLPYLNPGIVHASGPLITAMAAGKLVVASKIPIFEGEIEDGKTGLLFDEDDVQSLKAKLGLLRTQPELVERVGAAAANHILTEHNQDMILKQLMSVYGSL